MKLVSFAMLVLAVAVFSSPAPADSIHLRDGRHLEGKYVGGTTNMVGFMTSGAVEYFPTSDVLALMFDGSDNPFNGVQPNPMNGNPAGSNLGITRNSSVLPRKHTRQPRLNRVNAAQFVID